jgi:hypothetical protein
MAGLTALTIGNTNNIGELGANAIAEKCTAARHCGQQGWQGALGSSEGVPRGGTRGIYRRADLSPPPTPAYHWFYIATFLDLLFLIFCLCIRHRQGYFK